MNFINYGSQPPVNLDIVFDFVKSENPGVIDNPEYFILFEPRELDSPTFFWEFTTKSERDDVYLKIIDKHVLTL